MFADLDKVNATEVAKLLTQKKKEEKQVLAMVAEAPMPYGNEPLSDIQVLENYLSHSKTIKETQKELKEQQAALEKLVLKKYPALTENEIKTTVLQHKWQAHLQSALLQEQERISQHLTQRIKELAERYATTLPTLEAAVNQASQKVAEHLKQMGWV